MNLHGPSMQAGRRRTATTRLGPDVLPLDRRDVEETVNGLGLPRRDLVGVDVKLPSQFGRRLFSVHSREGRLGRRQAGHPLSNPVQIS